MEFEIMMKMMVVLAALLMSINAAPVNNTTTISDYSYCNVTSGSPPSSDLLYTLCDDLYNTLEVLGNVCSSYDAIVSCLSKSHRDRILIMYSVYAFQSCTIENIPEFTIPEDRDSQNDAINAQLEVFKGQLLLLDAACAVEESKAARGISSLLEVCETLYCTLKPLSWNIVDYVRSQ